MREILFRGKRTDNGEWVYGMLTLDDFITYEEPHIERAYCIKAIPNEKCECLYWVQVIPETIGQYTGLTDKNGTKIFEGDIIRYADNDEYRMYLESLECPEEYEGVNFSDLWTIDSVVYGVEIGYPAFDLNNHEWECNGLSNLKESYQYFYEVIGNIHDNLELIENEV